VNPRFLFFQPNRDGKEQDMSFGKGVIFILTREDIIDLAREAGIPEDTVDDRFLEEIKGGVGDLLAIEIKRFMREIIG
jgi:hypothetical protein